MCRWLRIVGNQDVLSFLPWGRQPDAVVDAPRLPDEPPVAPPVSAVWSRPSPELLSLPDRRGLAPARRVSRRVQEHGFGAELFGLEAWRPPDAAERAGFQPADAGPEPSLLASAELAACALAHAAPVPSP